MVTYEAAARILAAHSMHFRPSAEAGRIEALAHYVDADGNGSSEWESITLSIPAIRDWLEDEAVARYGYARVSTVDQSADIQEAALRAAGCDIIRSEKVSGTSRKGRSELDTLLQFLRGGDTLAVTRIDRLARSVKDLQDLVHDLKARGVTLVATEQPIDTSTAAGKCFLDMLGVFAEFETNLRRERQLEGIEAAKAKGIYKGRKPSIDAAEVRRMAAEGLGPTAIADRLGITRGSVYRLLAEQKAEQSANGAA